MSWLSWMFGRQGRIHRTAREFSKSVSGWYVERPDVGTALVHFAMGRQEADLRWGSSWTRLEVRLASPAPGLLYLHPERWEEADPGKLPAGLPLDLEVGEPAFDAQYVIRTSPPEFCGHLFSPERRAEVVAWVTRLARIAAPRIDLSRDALSLEWGEVVTHVTALRLLVRCAEDLLGWLDELRCVFDIQWIDVPAGGEIGQCQVCGNGMREPVARCARCATPHHPECWKYLGRCSTYACGSLRAQGLPVEPPVARRWEPVPAPPSERLSDVERAFRDARRSRVGASNRAFYDAYREAWRLPGAPPMGSP